MKVICKLTQSCIIFHLGKYVSHDYIQKLVLLLILKQITADNAAHTFHSHSAQNFRIQTPVIPL